MKRIGVAILRFLRRRRVDRDDGRHYVGSDQDTRTLLHSTLPKPSAVRRCGGLFPVYGWKKLRPGTKCRVGAFSCADRPMTGA